MQNNPTYCPTPGLTSKKEIKKSTPLATSEPTEMVQTISQRLYKKFDAYSLMLLIGNVGSGKTTFVRYFKKMFLERSHPDLAKRCDLVNH